MGQQRVGVWPPDAFAGRRRLFAALARAYEVSFESAAPADSELDGLLLLPSRTGPSLGGVAAIPSLTMLEDEECERHESAGAWQLSAGAVGLGPLAGRSLIDSGAGRAAGFAVSGTAAVLAWHGRNVVWARESRHRYLAALCPAELAPGERLRSRFRPGRFAALLPVVHFLRELTGETFPPLRAAFVVDDPNLRRPTYGYLDYAEVAEDAARSGYHLAVAMVPLDARRVHPKVVSVFREHEQQLSLAVHGNDHVRHELARLEPPARIARRVSSALARVAAFERESGLAVARVMVPPHGVCSLAALDVVRAHGFEGVTLTRPPVGAQPDALDGWRAGERGGMPILPRVHVKAGGEELAFRAFLGQPLIVYGHHGDLRGGAEILSEVAGEVARLGDPTWLPLGAIARSAANADLPSLPAPAALRTSPRAGLGVAGRRALTEARDRLAPVIRPARHDRNETRGGRVLLLVQNLSVPADRRVWQECLSLRDAGFEPTVICPTGVDHDVETYDVQEGVTIHRYVPRVAQGSTGSYVVEYAWAMWMTWRLVRALQRRHDFDVVHACNPPDVLLLTALSARRRGARFVFDQHDLVPELFAAKFGERSFAHGLVVAAERLAFRLADVVLATNESYRAVALTRGGKRPDDVFVVRNGPDLRRLATPEFDPGLRRGKRFLLVYAGLMGAQDGTADAIRALARLRRRRDDWHAVFAGRGDALPGLRRLAERLGLDGVVEFAGWLGDEPLQRLIASADVCLAPEPRNALNERSTMVKVAEYMAFGRPIVATDLVETIETAGGAAVYAEAGNPADFAARIDQLLADRALSARLGAAAEERVKSMLSWERSELELLAAYRRALRRPSTSVTRAPVADARGA
jgi:glycosyltransferase involved in cell wall biosynthesis